MKTTCTLLFAAMCASALPLAASASPLSHRHHRFVRSDVSAAGYAYATPYRHHIHPTSAYGDAQQDGSAFNAGAAQVPPRGYYDGYEGPGATILKRTLAAQYEPGLTEELSPGAKQTATGGPVGGVPGFGGGR